MNEKLEVFPKWKYHEKKEAQIFKTAEELEKAGPGWVDSPADFGKPLSAVNETPTDSTVDSEDDETEKEDFSKLTNKALITKMVNEYGFNIRDIEKNNKAQLIDKLEKAIEEASE